MEIYDPAITNENWKKLDNVILKGKNGKKDITKNINAK